LVSASADNNLRKTRFGGFFYGESATPSLADFLSDLFFRISRIPSPQRSQNLVNYHPLLCPNNGECSIFVLFLNRIKNSLGWAVKHLAGLYGR